MEKQHDTPPHDKMGPQVAKSAGYLVTPPEEIHHTFASQDAGVYPAKQPASKHAIQLPPIHTSHTPPTSPEYSTLPSIATATGFSSHDPTLYPDEPAQPPLFPQEPRAAVPATPRNGVVAPDVRWPNILNIQSPSETMSYWRERYQELRDNQKLLRDLPRPKRTTAGRREPFDQQQVSRITQPVAASKITKPRAQPKVATKPKAAAAASPTPTKATPTRKRTPKLRSSTDLGDSFPGAQQPTKHKRAPPSKKVEGNSAPWYELPNYAPPISTLDAFDKAPEVSWKSNTALNIDNDPDRHLLHPHELHVASVLRLTCQQYLTNKRKIFMGKLQFLKEGHHFGKTHAQQFCAIDVNKASQLWVAFDQVGWFEKEWFDQFM
ncbi:uncharacterized protein LTR77_002714 [Saxophila tyrrhenica]|uniref:SWIRM domain-containing protein n=1 Tax=Saxophila tyrrhenica TaxID=1690608 RepID=A0AAV9PI60_9PEZI|nr:hypothetical protein LTR77_002714 [Saxophila tyrrhenica]